MKDELYDRLRQFVMEAEKARQEAYEESIRRKKAEKDVIDAVHRVNSQSLSLISILKLNT